jgi:hypothetical protein
VGGEFCYGGIKERMSGARYVQDWNTVSGACLGIFESRFDIRDASYFVFKRRLYTFFDVCASYIV